MVSRYLLGVRYAHSLAIRPREQFTPVIGLEVHVQLSTLSKLFSCAPIIDDSPPNTTVHPHDMAIPGTLPSLNKQCLMSALKMALLLNCEIPEWCRFDRKHYFYADMPAGYQITQSERPVAKNGSFEYFVFDESIEEYKRTVSILQLQLEQDSGKTIHHGNNSLVDLNRAGSPLVEIVTSACIRSALEAVCFVQQLRLLLVHHGICHGHLHKGHMRVDANVSLSEGEKMGVRTEIKNINSFRHLHTAINYEIDRQYRILSEGGRVLNETRGCDQQGRTVPMRDKEEETDYRLMVEPNLPIVKIRDEWIKECSSQLNSSLPLFVRYMKEIGLDARRAIHFAEDPELSSFLDSCSPFLRNQTSQNSGKTTVPLELFFDWLKELKQICQRTKVVYPPQSQSFPIQFMRILSLFEEQRLTRLRSIDLIRSVVEGTVENVEEYIQKESLWRIHETKSIDILLGTVIEKNANIWEKAQLGNSKSINKLRNSMVDHSKKCVTVEDAEDAIKRRVKQE